MIYDGFYDPPLLSWWSSPPPAAWDAGTAPSRTGSGSLLLHLQAVGNHFTEIAVTSLINHLRSMSCLDVINKIQSSPHLKQGHDLVTLLRF